MSNDAIVVGGSFAGLSAAMQLARARQRVLVVDSGLPRNRFAAAAHGFLGQDGRSPAAILREAGDQIMAYPTVRRIAGEAVSARAGDGGFAVTLADGREETGRRLVLATGVKDELPLSGMQERWGRSVLHCPYCHGYEVRDQPLGVIAFHPLAVHLASLIPDWGPTTYFSQGRFEPDHTDGALLAARGVRIESTPVSELLGAEPELEAVRLVDGRVIPVRAVFVAPRTEVASPLARELGCTFEDGPLGAFIQVDDLKQTSVPGVYAAGDAATAMGNATLASAAGFIAGVAAHQSLARAGH